MFGLFTKKSENIEFPWVGAAISAAESHNIRSELFIALILNESSGNQFASRWERKFYIRYLADKPLETLGANHPTNLDPYQETIERLCRATSWGLTQVMGQTAREHGYRGRHLWELLDVEANVKIGAQIFAHKRDVQTRQAGPMTSDELERKALLAYNGGGDLAYPDRVYKRLKVAEDLKRFYLKAQRRV